MDMSTYELHSNKVIPLSTIVKDKSVLIRGFELEVDVDHVVSLELRKAQICVVGCE